MAKKVSKNLLFQPEAKIGAAIFKWQKKGSRTEATIIERPKFS